MGPGGSGAIDNGSCGVRYAVGGLGENRSWEGPTRGDPYGRRFAGRCGWRQWPV